MRALSVDTARFTIASEICETETAPLRMMEMPPRCFLHVPKTAGSSIRYALEKALSPGSVAPSDLDASSLCLSGQMDLDALPFDVRARMVFNADQVRALAGYRAIAGHFSLSTLLEVAPPASIVTVLREPRARLLSLLMSWRLWARWHDVWAGSAAAQHALGPLNDFLSAPQAAQAVDNVISRMLVGFHPRVPPAQFIAARDIEEVASAAVQRLDQLAFVGVLELGESVSEGLSQVFEVPLDALKERENIFEPGIPVELPAAQPRITVSTLDLLEARTAADAIVYRHALERAGLSADSCARVVDAAFAQQLVRFGDLTGRSSHRVGALSEALWERRVAAAITAIVQHVPDGEAVVVADEQQWELSGRLGSRNVVRFMERDGVDLGHPEDTESALRELERLRDEGLGFLAIGWPAFWWLECYPGLSAYLRAHYICLREDEDVLIFGLNGGSE